MKFLNLVTLAGLTLSAAAEPNLNRRGGADITLHTGGILAGIIKLNVGQLAGVNVIID
jgi:hypothetical protein